MNTPELISVRYRGEDGEFKQALFETEDAVEKFIECWPHHVDVYGRV